MKQCYIVGLVLVGMVWAVWGALGQEYEGKAGARTEGEKVGKKERTESEFFDAADRNGDGRVSFDEYMVRAVTLRYDQMDANHDGKVSQEEAQKAQAAEKASSFRGMRFEKVDVNQDGFVSREEMEIAAQKDEGAKLFFDMQDEDRDGFLSRSECRQSQLPGICGGIRFDF